LRNPDFEAFSQRGAGEMIVANRWEPWWVQGTDDQVKEGYFYRPEYKPESAALFGRRRIHSGDYAQKFFSTFATHQAGLYQQVSGIAPRSTLTFSAWIQMWSSSQDDPGRCDESGNYQAWIGIDPTGGRDAASDKVIWSEPAMACNRWVRLQVTAVAEPLVLWPKDKGSGTVTVFLKGEPEYRVKHNDSYWDDLVLIAGAPLVPTLVRYTSTPIRTATATQTPTPLVLGPKDPGPTRTPTWTTTPTRTPALTPTPATSPTKGLKVESPTPVASPSVTEPPTHTPVPVVSKVEPPTDTPGMEGGCLCVLAYDDRDADGQRDDGESLPSVLGPEDQGLVGAVVVVSDGSHVVGTYTTNGHDEPFCTVLDSPVQCFEDLPYGHYLVTWRSPRGYKSTTHESWSLALGAGKPSVTLAFGIRRGRVPSMAAITPASSLSKQVVSNWAGGTVYYIGGGALLLAVAGVGAGYVLKRERV